ncbi:MAG: glutamine--fructose-6-phosphate transaminase (isomerizing) [Candidatus Woesearchaeota archaeon]
MCGIIGYKGSENASPIIINGLKRLEYRGYDSWGVAIKNDKIEVLKKVGKISKFSEKIPESKIAVAHTRWGTHGKVTEANSHPHTGCKGKIAVVHNGIIENYQELKKELEKKGHIFKSETDSEVIPHLIEEYRGPNNFLEAAMLALRQLEGNYAVVIIEEGSDTMIGARNGSPLVVGIKGKSWFMASDVPAFLEHTNQVVFLDDGEMAVAGKELNFFEIKSGEQLKKESSKVNLDITQAEKGKYPYFFIKEIMEQGESLRRTLNQDRKLLLKAAEAINKSKSITVVACGTAYNASLIGSYFLREIADKKADVILGSEFDSMLKFIDKESLVIAVSQSGETADVLGPIKLAKNKGATIISLVNVQGSSLYRISDIALPLYAGPEIAVASTKAFTSQGILMALIAFACKGKFEEGKKLLEDTARKIKAMLGKRTDQETRELAEIICKKDIFCIGRGSNFPVALEAALKIKEVTCLHAEGLAGGELKHHTLALIEEGTPCIVFFSNDKQKKDMLSNAAEVKARGGFMVGIGPERHEIFDYFITVPEAGIISPLINMIPAQLLTYHLGIKLGCEIDYCKGLAKSVTVK